MADVRLIDANALKSLLIEVMERIKESPKMTRDEMHIIAGCHMLCEMIDDATTIDAVPVVRCRECKYARPLVQEEWVECIMWRRGSLVDGFCHMGAKMDGGAE